MATTVSPQSVAIQRDVGGQVKNPQLPQGATVNATAMNVGTGELMATPGAAATAPIASRTASQAATAPVITGTIFMSALPVG